MKGLGAGDAGSCRHGADVLHEVNSVVGPQREVVEDRDKSLRQFACRCETGDGD
jgi:hypothetical protein